MNKNLPKSFFDLIQQSDVPVVVDFWAPWCGPCKMVSPALEQLAREYKGKLIVIKINVDEKQQIAGQYQIQSIPTIMMFYRGNTLMRLTGALPYETIKREVEKNLS
ncbi:thioredoxin [candidate division KSB1 bacterium]|nr:thioredoxin [candidate division KSB1 bacterium]MBL7093590.1 thioredoxin [candidate division KSB1 bacterium]